MRTPTDAPTALYRVRVASELDGSWAALLDGWELAPAGPGATAFERRGADQAALYGLILRLRDLGLVLLAVERLDTS
ncbi:MAG TPA: hypothetical protein PKD53_02100 [Chloroflexaceae bacterium]|nr:hypothetical protein [Chloroflexaceae bacterium]